MGTMKGFCARSHAMATWAGVAPFCSAIRFNRFTTATFAARASGANRGEAELWSTFARTGKPAAKGQPEWPAYTAAKRATYYIDAQCEVVNDPYPLERQLWERIDP
jgi:carboxylesterase type B